MESGARSDATGGKGDWLYPALALAEHIDEVTLPTRPSYAKWTLQTGRPLNLICTSGQLPVKPRPDGGVDSLLRTSTPVCLFTDRFPSRISHFSPPVLTTQPSRWQPSLVISGFPCNFFLEGGNTISFFFFIRIKISRWLNFDGNCLCTTRWILQLKLKFEFRSIEFVDRYLLLCRLNFVLLFFIFIYLFFRDTRRCECLCFLIHFHLWIVIHKFLAKEV